MLSLCQDVLCILCDELTDSEKMSLLSTSKLISWLKHQFIYHTQIQIHKIHTLPFYDNFSRVKMNVTGYFDCKKYKGGKLPQSVTHLEFDDNFDYPIDNLIPQTVTHLTFGWNFNQKIMGNIPSSVTNLTFGYRFNQPIEHCIPSSVTHLSFDVTCHSTRSHNYIISHRNQHPIKDELPPSVRYLIFNKKIKRLLKDEAPIFSRKIYKNSSNILMCEKHITITFN
uniref:F-box and FNIP repeat-containing protein n=1 Tax=viral metagenome TaxID=1070528 RepID=A0A6C0C8L4_9ZZZZ